MSELLRPCVLPSPPAWPAMGKSAHVAISAVLHRENPTAAVSSRVPDNLQCLFTHHHFGLRSRALRSSPPFGFCTGAHLFPGTCSWACLSAPTVTQLLGSTSGSQIQTYSSGHQKGMCTRTSMRTPHASSQAERRIKAVQGAKGSPPSGAMKPPPAHVAAGLMQFPPGLSWGNGLSMCWSPRGAVLQPDPDTASRKHRVKPGQGTFTPTKYPSPRWLPHLCSSPPSHILLGIPLQTPRGKG